MKLRHGMSKRFFCLAPLAAFYGALITTSASAIPLLETQANVTTGKAGIEQSLTDATATVFGASRDLIFDSTLSGNAAGVGKVAETNRLVLGLDRLDPLARIETDEDNSFANKTEQFSILPDDTILDGALTVSCTSTDNKCSAFDWDFDITKTTLAVDWNIVKIGVKYGGPDALDAYFLIDPFGIGGDGGSFNLANYVDFASPSGPLSPIINTADNLPFALSHVDFFGTPQAVPEPGSLAILGASLLGLGLLRWRLRH